MIQKIADTYVFFIGVLHGGYKLGQPAVQGEALLLICLHKRGNGAGRFGRRGQVVYRPFGYRLQVVVGIITERLVVNDLSVFCHQHLASGEGFGTKSLLHNTVNLGKLSRVETGGFGLLITQADRFGGESRSGKI